MSESPHVKSAVRACRLLKTSEGLLARCGFYATAATVRDQRESVEECTVESVSNGRPKTGDYKPRTVGDLVPRKGGA